MDYIKSVFGYGNSDDSSDKDGVTSEVYMEGEAFNWIRMTACDQPVMEVNSEVSQKILQPLGEETVNLISIFGAARQGKSFLMNLLAGQDGLFRISNNQDPCTQGIDISGRFISLRNFETANGRLPAQLQSGEAIKIGFLDAEGQGDRDQDYDARLISPVLLTSKVVILNWKDTLQKDRILSQLGIMSRAAMNVKSEQENEDRTDSVFGHLLIVFRDWALEGNPASVYKVIFDPERGQAPDVALRNQVRRNVLACFKSVAVWLLPSPCDQVNTLKEELTTEMLNDEFHTQVVGLRQDIARCLQEPTYFNGKILTGTYLASLVPTLVEILNSGNTILPKSAYLSMLNNQVIAEREHTNGYFDMVVGEMKEAMRVNPISREELEAMLEQNFTGLIQNFKKDARNIGGSPDVIDQEILLLGQKAKYETDALLFFHDDLLRDFFKAECKRSWESFCQNFDALIRHLLPLDPDQLSTTAESLKAEGLSTISQALRSQRCDLEEAQATFAAKADCEIMKIKQENEKLTEAVFDQQQGMERLEDAKRTFERIFANDIEIGHERNILDLEVLAGLHKGHSDDIARQLLDMYPPAAAQSKAVRNLVTMFHCHTDQLHEAAKVKLLVEQSSSILLKQVTLAKTNLQLMVKRNLYPQFPMAEVDVKNLYDAMLNQIIEDVASTLSGYAIDERSKSSCIDSIREDCKLIEAHCMEKNRDALEKIRLTEQVDHAQKEIKQKDVENSAIKQKAQGLEERIIQERSEAEQMVERARDEAKRQNEDEKRIAKQRESELLFKIQEAERKEAVEAQQNEQACAEPKQKHINDEPELDRQMQSRTAQGTETNELALLQEKEVATSNNLKQRIIALKTPKKSSKAAYLEDDIENWTPPSQGALFSPNQPTNLNKPLSVLDRAKHQAELEFKKRIEKRCSLLLPKTPPKSPGDTYFVSNSSTQTSPENASRSDGEEDEEEEEEAEPMELTEDTPNDENDISGNDLDPYTSRMKAKEYMASALQKKNRLEASEAEVSEKEHEHTQKETPQDASRRKAKEWAAKQQQIKERKLAEQQAGVRVTSKNNKRGSNLK